MDKYLAGLIVVFAISGCTATTNIRSSNSSDSVMIRGSDQTGSSRTESYWATSFSNYPFKVTESGKAPFYGILPLKFNGGYLAADILFFAPAMTYNLREVYPYYEFDAARQVVKFKKHESDSWREYTPAPEEMSRAKQYFGG